MGPYMTSVEYLATCFGFFPLNWTLTSGNYASMYLVDMNRDLVQL